MGLQYLRDLRSAMLLHCKGQPSYKEKRAKEHEKRFSGTRTSSS